ncbi:MAG: hypothetical protein NT075_01070, partial [Chloroflexi bacterium]|nr:hypothetical protein [Chloroflexota bacterium]
RGAYYENLIITAPLKLQGVGPGGFQGNTFVPGSIIDGGAFGGDTALADAWRTKIATLIDADGNPTWQGNPNVNDGQTIYLLALSQTQYGTNYKASIDGFDLRGADQQGFPTNINEIGGGPTGLPPNVVTQGGAIFANAYVRNLQITNNVVQNNGGGYGTIRIGTPDLPQPNTSQHNENVRIANNRVIANGGTNLAGGIGLFAGADGYDVAANDICGNFSAEYGGGITIYGLSPNGKLHDNRIYFNRSYDEGGGIMIAGELPANPATLSPGTGPVDIYNNLIQANLGNDDGGGLRFLMAGNFPFNVYNNIIVNNVSTHEGGGIGINDAPNVRVYNNTIMKNLTTATAVTSDGTPAPAGLSTSQNSTMLQATLPSGSSIFSNPVLFNNIFWDNRAGTRGGSTVIGLGAAGDATPINNWDLGVADGTGLLAPTNSTLQQSAGAHPFTVSPTNSALDPAVVATYDASVAFSVWRNNPNFVGAILVALDLPANLLGNYHLQSTSPAQNLGAASKGAVNAPLFDIDNQTRPALGGYDIGADELPGNIADLAITKTDNQTNVVRGSQVTYNIVVANAGPNAVNLVPVVDNVPATLTGVTWTCTATGGSSCNAASGSGNAINTSVNLATGGSATFAVIGTLPLNATATTLANTATVAAPAGTTDPNASNNSATDTDTIVNPPADLAITKTDNQTSANAGGAANYSIVVTNNGPSVVTGATVVDTFPAILTVGSWTCAATAGSSCTVAGTGNNRTGTVTLLNGGSATFTANTSVVVDAAGNLVNTATVTAPASVTDPNTTNNSASDTDSIVPALPTLNTLDNFNRANATTLNTGAPAGVSWSVANGSTIAVNTNQASSSGALLGLPATAYWNGPSNVFGATQGAAFTFANTPVNGASLILKASGTAVAGVLPNFIRVRYNAGQVIVETTTNLGISYTSLGSFAATFANGDTLTAVANTNGSVDVWKTTAANVTGYLGHSATSSFTSTGRIGLQLPNGTRVDNFKGGNSSLIVVAIAGVAFPQTTLLNTFSVANGPLDNGWAGAVSPNNFRIQSKQVQSRQDSGAVWWNPGVFGANQEAFLTFKRIGKSSNSTLRWQGLVLKLNGGEPENVGASLIDVRYASTKGVQVRTKASGQGWILQAMFSAVTFSNGDQLGVQAQADGTVIVYKNRVSIGSVNVTSGPAPWPTAYASAGGSIGVTYNFTSGRFDDFGGGDMTSPLVAAAASDALGEPVESDITVTEVEEGIDEDAAEPVDSEIYLPLVAALPLESEVNLAAALPAPSSEADQTTANSIDSNRDHAIYLPLVSNQ